MSQPRKVFSFAKMMVLAQRRHDSRQAATRQEGAVTSPTPTQQDEQATQTSVRPDPSTPQGRASRRPALGFDTSARTELAERHWG